MSDNRYDAAIVGSGIIGLAHAYHLARAGMKVAVFERNARPVGASIRNFGMIWPVGQPAGPIREAAVESRAHWLTMLRGAGIWYRECGSLHLAYSDDELGVLEEFVEKGSGLGYRPEMISAQEATDKSPVIKEAGLRGAMWNAEELCVFPRGVMQELPPFLRSKLGVKFHFNSPINEVGGGFIVSGSHTYHAEHIMVCPGEDLRTLFGDLFALEPIKLCKLQMLRAKPKDRQFNIGPHLCAGLTLGHYANFQICSKLPALSERFAKEMPDHVKWGIHLLVSQHADGGLTIGDSHEYPEAVDPFLSAEIESLILQYLDTFLPVEELEIIERWHGVYAKHVSKPYALLRPFDKVAVLAGVGGTGMTLSFGLAAKVLRELGWVDVPVPEGDLLGA